MMNSDLKKEVKLVTRVFRVITGLRLYHRDAKRYGARGEAALVSLSVFVFQHGPQHACATLIILDDTAGVPLSFMRRVKAESLS
jgi:hypothetical protein